MKKFFIVLSVLLLIILGGCSKPEKNKKTYEDEHFLTAFKTGLEKRWDYIESDSEHDTAESYEKAIKLELDQIEKYTNKTFKDSKLQEQAISYINILQDGIKELELFGTESFDTNWAKIYDKRSNLIVAIVENYNIKFNDKYVKYYKEFKANKKEIEIKETQKEEIAELIKTFNYEQIPSDDGGEYKTYETVVENTTNFDFSSFSINIKLIDEDGVTVETAYGDAPKWKKGEKHKFEFMTDKEFKSVEVIENYIEVM